MFCAATAWCSGVRPKASRSSKSNPPASAKVINRSNSSMLPVCITRANCPNRGARHAANAASSAGFCETHSSSAIVNRAKRAMAVAQPPRSTDAAFCQRTAAYAIGVVLPSAINASAGFPFGSAPMISGFRFAFARMVVFGMTIGAGFSGTMKGARMSPAMATGLPPAATSDIAACIGASPAPSSAQAFAPVSATRHKIRRFNAPPPCANLRTAACKAVSLSTDK